MSDPDLMFPKAGYYLLKDCLQKKCSGFDLPQFNEKVTRLILIGFPSQKAINKLTRWSFEDVERKVYIFCGEPMIKVLYDDLNSQKNNTDFTIFFIEKFLDESLEYLSWECALKTFQIIDLTKRYETLKLQIQEAIYSTYSVIGSVKSFREEIFSNTQKNASQCRNFYLAQNLKGVFGQIPAVICGAGPSLQEDLEEIRNLASRCLIFSGGTSSRILSEHALASNVSAFIDPGGVYERFHAISDVETLSVFLLQTNPEIMSLYQGEKVLDFDLTNPFEEGFFDGLDSDYKPEDNGVNVGNYLVYLAAHLGCSPILLTGMDMGYKNSEYALDLEKENKSEESLEGIGAELKTRKDLFLGKCFFETLPGKFPKTSFYQSESCFTKLKTFHQISTKEYGNRLVFCDVEAKVFSRLSKQRKFHRLNLSFAKNLPIDIKHADAIAKKACQKIKEINEKISLEAFLALEEFELEQTTCYEILLRPLWMVWQNLLLKDSMSSNNQEASRWLFFKSVLTQYVNILAEEKE